MLIPVPILCLGSAAALRQALDDAPAPEAAAASRPLVRQEGPPAPGQAPVSGAQQVQARGLSISFDEEWTSLVENRRVFKGHITAAYDQTVLTADSLEINEAQKEGWARGKVKIVDPEGEVEVDSIHFRWKDRSDPPFGPDEQIGEGMNARVRAGNVLLQAKSIQIVGGRWILTDAWGSLTQREKPEYKIVAQSVELTPGVSGVARRIYLEALGMKIGPLSHYRFNLNPRIESKITLPTYSRDENGHYGLAWSFARLLTDTSALRGSWNSFPKKDTSWNLTYTFTPIKDSQSSALISVPSDLSERADDGWMDSIRLVAPEQEFEEFRKRKLNYQIQTDWNSGASLRKASPENVVRLADLSVEDGRQIGLYGARMTSRFQVIRSRPEEDFRPRGVFEGAVQGPMWQLGRGLRSVARLDSFTSISGHALYGWLRGEAGLIYQPVREARFGLAYVKGMEAGSPDFEYDRLFSSSAVHFRADLQAGPITARWLGKYDLDMAKIYDREYELAYVAGAFEPYIQYRGQPSAYQFGIRFRMDNVAGRLVNREQNRRSSITR